jgi:acyl dehydratase
MRTYKWYFEDFVVGSSISLGSHQFTEEEIIEFAKKFDPQRFHIDRDAAKDSIFGGIIASGWHTCSVMMRLLVDGMVSDAASLGSPGVDEVRWIKPVRAGDTISVTLTVTDAKASASKSDRGVIWNDWRGTNQHGELVATIKSMGMFLRRPT